MRAFVIVLDSVGIGAAPDAADYGDAGASTLGHLAQAAAGIRAPVMQRLGLGNIPGLLPGGIPIQGVPPVPSPIASFGAMQERSRGKDTTTGHWEMIGILLEKGFHVFPAEPPSFPGELISEFIRLTGRSIIGNCAASGTRIIEELGARHIQEGSWIVYTSADSVMQIAAHEEVVPLQELYAACRIARRLCDDYFVGRVIARPFLGAPGHFRRTENRRDFSLPPPEPTILDRCYQSGLAVSTVGKLDDIFAGRSISQSHHVENNRDAQAILLKLAPESGSGLIFANLIDFDMLYGHRRDSRGYARAIEDTDAFLDQFLALLKPDDLLIVTADHGNDPTFRGTDHTREFVPLLVWRHGAPGASLGIRDGFFDVAQTLAAFFELPPMPRGISFLDS